MFAAAHANLGERVHDAQLAFFGGSFTAIDADYRRALLKAAQPFLGPEGFAGIRVSTRPDCIDADILDELAAAGVTAVELGAQSMSDTVLTENRRGHTAADTVRASQLIKAHGFELGLQMMTGLPDDSDAGAFDTAAKIVALAPDTVRIYPTLVLEHTALASLWRAGAYAPQTLDEAVALGARLLELFRHAGIPVIRFGLHDEAGLAVLAGPHHPALRELCQNRLLLDKARQALDGMSPGKVTLAVHPRCVSQMAGQHRCNLEALCAQGYDARVCGDEAVEPLTVQIR